MHVLLLNVVTFLVNKTINQFLLYTNYHRIFFDGTYYVSYHKPCSRSALMHRVKVHD